MSQSPPPPGHDPDRPAEPSRGASAHGQDGADHAAPESGSLWQSSGIRPDQATPAPRETGAIFKPAAPPPPEVSPPPEAPPEVAPSPDTPTEPPLPPETPPEVSPETSKQTFTQAAAPTPSAEPKADRPIAAVHASVTRAASVPADTSPRDASAAKPVMPIKPAGPPLVRLVDVHKAFGSHRVLAGVSLDFHPGQTTVILGPSGTGKSVLLKHIAGLLRPDQGQVWFAGQRVDQLKEDELVPLRKQMGFLFQMGALFDSMTVGQNIMFPLAEHDRRLSRQAQAERCEKLLAIVGLPGIAHKMPGDLSGGQKKRVALARAIALEPKLVLYDEPTTGLDPIRSDVINELILRLTRKLGIASIVVTHDMTSADKIADRMVMLYDGHVVVDDTPQAVHQSDNDLVRRFIAGQADQEELQAIRQGLGN